MTHLAGLFSLLMSYKSVLLLSLCFGLITATTRGQQTIIKTVSDAYPSISPDGRWIAFHSDRSGRQAIYVMDTSGNNLRQLTNLGFNEVTPKWSPDGEWITFAAEPERDNSEIYVMRKDGSSMKRLTTIPGDDSHPSWSRDGKKIIFNSPRSTPDPTVAWNKQHHEVYEMNPDGTGVRKLTSGKTVITYPCYSPDGKRIVYRKVVDEAGYNWDLSASVRNSEVFVANADGSNEVNVTKNAAFDGWPVWSPDDNWILFASNRAGPANVGALYVVRPDGSGVRKVSSGSMSYAQPSWSPDGKFIYAYAHVDAQKEFGFIERIEVDLGEGKSEK